MTMSQPPHYSHAPFPDLTGLRPEADKRRQNARILVNQTSHVGPADDALAVVAWLVLLSHLEPQADVDVACHFVADGEVRSARLRIDPGGPQPQTLAELQACITHSGPMEGVDTILTFGPSFPASGAEPMVERHADQTRVRMQAAKLDGPARTQWSLQGSSSVLDRGSADLVLRQFLALPAALAADDAPPPLSPALLQNPELRASQNPNPPRIPVDAEERFEHQFERVALSRPDHVALDFRESLGTASAVGRRVLLTYRELDERAALLASMLRSAGVTSDDSTRESDIVALCLEKSVETYVAILGVLKAGAAWCPIDTDWPEERRRALLAKCNAKVVLAAGDRVSRDAAAALPESTPLLRLDEVEWAKARNDQERVLTRTPASPEKLAYLIWTSGSTGLPKPVGIQHSAAVQALRALQGVIPYPRGHPERIRYLQFSAYNFDLMILDCFYTWGLGGTLCSSTRANLLSNLVATANEMAATHALLTPAVMAMIPRTSIPSLEVVINGGEKLSQVVADKWAIDCCLLNLYGPAEATLIAMHRRVPPNDQVKAPNIGIALPTVSTHVLTQRGEVALRGAVGELVLGGHQCAKGYIGEEQKTAERFRDHPTLGRVYFTGDLSRMLWDGNFEYLGRNDDQVKINGIRIELLEINAVVRGAHPDVQDSETMAVARGPTQEELQIVNVSVLPDGRDEIPALRTDADAATVAHALRGRAKLSLPGYMVPALFIIMNRFPKTSSAKVDRTAIKRLLGELDVRTWEERISREEEGKDGGAAPADEEASALEDVVRRRLGSICGIEDSDVGRHTPFPSLGLDSIRAIALSQALLLEDGLQISVIDLLAKPTLAELSREYAGARLAETSRIAEARAVFDQFSSRHKVTVCKMLGMEHTQIASVLPCAPLQPGMLIETQLQPDAYWLRRCWPLTASQQDDRRLRDAIAHLVREAEILRTGFVSLESDDGASTVAQVVHEHTNPMYEGVLNLDTQCQLEDAIIRSTDRIKPASVMSGQPPLLFALAECAQERYLVLAIHHSLYDAQSLQIMADYLGAAMAGKPTPALAPFAAAMPFLLPLNDGDSAASEATWTSATANFPRDHDGTLPPLSALGHDEVASMTARRGHAVRALVCSTSWSRLQATSRRLGTSSRPVLQTALARVLAAYCDAKSVVIGDSVSARSASADIGQVLGPVHTTLPLPLVLSKGMTRRDAVVALARLHQAVLKHQNLPLQVLRRILHIKSPLPLFECVFIFESEETTREDESHAAETFRDGEDFGVKVEHPLALEASTGADDTLRLRLIHDTDRVAPAWAELFLRQIDHEVTAMVEQPEGRILADAKEGWATTDVLSLSLSPALPGQDALPCTDEFVAKWAEATPDALAIVFEADLSGRSRGETRTSTTMSYASLESSVNRACAAIRSTMSSTVAGQEAANVVALCLPRSPQSWIWLLAILRSGATYLAIDVTLPSERKRLILADSGARFVVTSKELSSDFLLQDVRLTSEMLEHVKDAPKDAGASHGVRLDAAAYILYTSGSTGKPKACVLTHRNLSATLAAFAAKLEDVAPDRQGAGLRWLARSSEAFDVHLLEALLPLQVGGTICSAPREQILADVAEAMRLLRVTHAAVVPSLFFSKGRRVRPDDVPDLKVLIVGGEKMERDIVELWGGSKVPLLNAYGPSETCIGNSMARLGRHSSARLIGRPFHGTTYLVMTASHDGRMRLALRGQPGELCIAGLQLGSYLAHRPSEALDFTQWQGQAIYRTGDLARMGPDGEIEYLGRIATSRQVKIRGVRIELSEVDYALRQLMQVDAPPESSFWSGWRVSTQLARRQGREHLVSFLAPETSGREGLSVDLGRAPACMELRRHARRSLPAHMVPELVALGFLPLQSLSGKTDAKTLRDFYEGLDEEQLGVITQSQQKAGGEDDPVEIGELATKIREEVAKILRLSPDKISMHADLFGLGLDSLSALSLSANLRRHGMSISAADILQRPVISELCESTDVPSSAVSSEEAEADYVKMCDALRQEVLRDADIPASDIEEVIPCLPTQASLVAQTLAAAEDREGGRRVEYVHCAKLTLDEGVDLGRLRRAWHDALRSHAIYRTTFIQTSLGIVQVTLRQQAWAMPWEQEQRYEQEQEQEQDVEHTAPTSPTQACHAVQAKHSIDIISQLARRPAYRLTTILRGRSAAMLVVSMHHALYDGVSWAVLLDEIEQRYFDQAPRRVAASFANVAKNVWMQSIQRKDAFWRSAMQDATITSFPNLTGERYKGRPTAARLSVDRVLSKSLQSLRDASRTSRITLQTLTLAAFSRLLAQYVGESDVIIGLVLSGRTLGVPDIQNVHGPCITTVPCAVSGARRLSSETGMQEIQRKVAELLPYQHHSLSRIARAAGIDGANLFDVLFSFLPSSSRSVSRKLFIKEESEMLTEYPLALEVGLDDEQNLLRFHLEFSPEILTVEHASLLLAQLEHGTFELAGLSDNLLPPEELRSVVNPRPYTPTLPAESFIERFRMHAQRSPTSVAFVWAETMREAVNAKPTIVTYAELDAKSEDIARRLHQLDAATAAVYLPTGPLLYATLLGVWKAGKTYMPLDPALPTERLTHMLSIVQDAVLLTRQDLKQAARRLGRPLVLDDPQLVGGVKTSQLHPISPQDLDVGAYILFTSGSTGRPKGTKVSQRALAACLYSWERMLPHKAGQSRLLQLASPGFDVSLIEICMPLALGYSFASAPKDILLDDMEGAFHALGVTQADLPAALAATAEPSRLPKLEWLMSGGDIISERTMARWACLGLVNAWGPTEATIGNTLGFVSENSSRSLIGSAYPTSTILVLEEDSLATVPRGAVGELCVGGCQVAQGYIGQADLTAEKFVRLDDGTPLYRTGDRGRILVDGRVECLGRMQAGQVKINGQRLELGEISHALREQSGIADATTYLLSPPGLSAKQLVSFVCVHLREANRCQSDRLRLSREVEVANTCRRAIGSLQDRLPHYMIPTYVLALETATFPKTVNDKVDHNALSRLFGQLDQRQLREFNLLNGGNDDDDDADDAKLTQEERTVAEVLGTFVDTPLESMGRTTTLYQLGIDSISGIRVAKELRKRGILVTVRQMFNTPTIGQLARCGQTAERSLADVRRAYEHRRNLLLRDVQREGHGPLLRDRVYLGLCTPLQSGMLSQTLVSQGRTYIGTYLLRVPAAVKSETVWAAWETLVSRFDILRTSFHYSKLLGDWFSAIHEDTRVRRREIVEPDLARATDLAEGLLHFEDEGGLERGAWAATILVVGPQRFFSVTLHHALYDADSIAFLLKQLDSAVIAIPDGMQAPRQPIGFQQLLPFLVSDERDTAYWLEHLSGYHSRPLSQSRPGAPGVVEASQLCEYSVQALQAVGQKTGVALSTICHLALAKQIALMTNSAEVVIGSIYSLRDAMEGAEHVVGPAINTLPVRATFKSHESRSQSLLRLQHELDAARPHRKASLRDVERGFLRREGRELSLDVLFDFTVAESTSEAEPRALRLLEREDRGEAQYPLNVSFTQSGDTLRVLARAHASAFEQHQLERLIYNVARDCCEELDAKTLSEEEALHLSAVDEVEDEAKKASTRAPMATPTDAQVRDLLEILTDCIDLEAVDIDLTLSPRALGIDSIISIKVVSQARRRGLRLGGADVVAARSLAELASRLGLRGENGTRTAGTVVSVPSAELLLGTEAPEWKVERVMPALPIQTLFIAQSVLSQGRTGSFSFAYRSAVSLDSKRMRTAWFDLVARHPTLRMSFAVHDGRVYQVVWMSQQALLREKTWDVLEGGVDASEAEIMYDLRRGQDAFALASRCTLVRRSPHGRSDLLILQLHHACYDAFSLRLLIEQLAKLYVEGSEATLPRDDFAELVHLCARDGERGLPQVASFWRTHLAGGQVWPLQRRYDGARDSRPESTFVFQRSILTGLRGYEESARRCGTSMQMLLIAAWARVARELSNLDRPIVGLYHLGRDDDVDGMDDMAAPTMVVLPLLLPARGESLVGEAVAVRDALDSQRPRQRDDLTDIWRSSRADDKASQVDKPLFTSFVNLIWTADPDRKEDCSHSNLFEPVQFEEEAFTLQAPARKVPRRLTPFPSDLGRVAQDRLSIDISVNRDADAIDVGVRCDADVMSRAEVLTAVQRLVHVVTEALS